MACDFLGYTDCKSTQSISDRDNVFVYIEVSGDPLISWMAVSLPLSRRGDVTYAGWKWPSKMANRLACLGKRGSRRHSQSRLRGHY